MITNSVDEVVSLDLCTSCGICSAVCPVDAIEYTEKKQQMQPMVLSERCINCGKCISVCSAYSVYEESNDSYQISEYMEEGCDYSSWTMSVKDPEKRKAGQSGGIISSFIEEALDKGLYQGAFLALPETLDSGFRFLTLCEEKSQVFKNAGSKYVPYAISPILNYIGKDQKYIIVTIPCHLQSLKKYIKQKKIDDSNLIYFGLFCDCIMHSQIINYFKKSFVKDEESFIEFKYRGQINHDWPGEIEVLNKTGVDSYSKRYRMLLKRYLKLYRCRFCGDKLNRFSDISFGDCYVAGTENPLGNSSVVVRTNKGTDFFNGLDLSKFNRDSIPFSLIQSSQEVEKKINNIIQSLSLPIPIYPHLKISKEEAKQVDSREIKYQRRIRSFFSRKWVLSILLSKKLSRLEKIFRLEGLYHRFLRILWR